MLFGVIIYGGGGQGLALQNFPQIKVSGIVTDLNGRPLKNALIELLSAKNHTRFFSSQTNSEGFYDFSIESPPDSNYIMRFSLVGYVTEELPVLQANSSRSWSIDKGLIREDSTKAQEREIRFSIRDEKKNPISQAKIEIICPFNPTIRGTGYTYSKAEWAGKWIWKHKYEGQFVVYISKPGFEIFTQVISIESGKDQVEVIELTLKSLH